MSNLFEIIRASFAYTRLSDDAFLGRLDAVAHGMEGNTYFHDSPVDNKEFKADIDQFRVLVVAARDGSKTARAARDRKRKELTVTMKRIANYVEVTSNGNLEAFLSSGFEPAFTTRTPAEPLPPATIDKIEQLQPGQFAVSPTPLDKARMYELHYAALVNGAPAPWISINTHTARPPILIDGLTPLTTYTFQIRAFGARGFTPWSDPITRTCV